MKIDNYASLNQCLSCGHDWYPRNGGLSNFCPKCCSRETAQVIAAEGVQAREASQELKVVATEEANGRRMGIDISPGKSDAELRMVFERSPVPM